MAGILARPAAMHRAEGELNREAWAAAADERGVPVALHPRGEADSLAAAALGISAFGSFIAGTLSVIALTFLAPFLSRVTLRFGPPEYFALMALGLTLLTFFARDGAGIRTG